MVSMVKISLRAKVTFQQILTSDKYHWPPLFLGGICLREGPKICGKTTRELLNSFAQ